MSEDTLAEDTDITIAMHREGWRVVYQEHAKAWTEAPGSLKQLWSQRYRWSYGTMQALWKHRKFLTDKGPSGRFGRVGMPLVVIFQIVTPVFAPLIDVFTLYSMIFIDFKAALPAWLAVLCVQLVCATYAFRLDQHEIALILAVPLIDRFWNVPAFEKWLPLESQWFMFGIGWVLIWIAIPLFGWVEDVAAKKKPKLLP